MPIGRTANGYPVYIPIVDYFAQQPHVRDFFADDPNELKARLAEARRRVIDVIRFYDKPLCGKGKNTDVTVEEDGVEALATLIHMADGQRAKRVSRQRRRKRAGHLAPNERRLLSPQDIKRRRSALFSGDDIPVEYVDCQGLSVFDLEYLVDLMRWQLVRDAIVAMQHNQELVRINDIWWVPVSVLDKHIAAGCHRHRKPTVKQDDRSFHGRPNRDRRGPPAT